MSFAQILKFIIRASIALIFIGLAITSVLILSYYLGGSTILDNSTIIGSDNTYHLSFLHVLDRFWPRVPLWFPYAGAGSSLVFGYWVVPYYAVLALAHASSFNVEQSLRLIQFLTVPAVAFELYLFGWLRLKNHLVGLVAALLYPLSSIAYGWIAHAGFYAMHTSLVTVVPALIFYDAYLEQIIDNRPSPAKRRLLLLGSGVFIAASLLTHLATGASLLLGLPVFTLVRSILQPSRTGKLSRFFQGVKALLAVTATGILLAFFLLFPQKRYFAYQALDFTPTFAAHEFPQLPAKGFLGLERLTDVGSLHTPLFLSPVIVILGFMGIGLGIIFRSPAGAIGVLALFYVFWMSHTRYLAANFPFLNIFLLPTNLRVAGIPGALFPLLAAYGVWSFVDLPGRAIRYLLKNFKIVITFFAKPATYLVAGLLTILLVVQLAYRYRHLQQYPQIRDQGGDVVEGYQGYGPLGLVLPFCLVPGWEQVGIPAGSTCQQLAPDLQNITISSTGRDPLVEMEFDKKMAPFNFKEGTRVAISSHLGAFMQAFTGHSRASMLNSPSGQSVLNLSWLGIQDQAFYQPGETTPKEVAQIAKWFGIDYVFLHEGNDQPVLSRYPQDRWPQVELLGNIVQMRQFSNSPGMAVISDKPAVLVIGSRQKRAYESVFRAAVKGVLPYDQVLLVQGKEKVDDYSLAQLQQFPVLILQGYSYKSRRRAWRLLRQYVQQGGGLFIDTGWQFIAKDWSTTQIAAPTPTFLARLDEPFPVTQTTWGNLGTSWQGFALDPDFTPGIQLSDFGSLSWETKAWSLAYASQDHLQSWAKPLLYRNRQVIIAGGQLGQGRVIWSGMNLLSHAYDKQSPAEYQLLTGLLSYLLPPSSPHAQQVSFSRSFPDRIEFFPPSASQSHWLYWAETYTPDWRARLVDGKEKQPLKIYPAGPGFQAVLLPPLPSPARVILEYNLNPVLIFSFSVTLLTFLLLIISIIDTLLLKQTLERHLKQFLVNRFGFFARLGGHRFTSPLGGYPEHENY